MSTSSAQNAPTNSALTVSNGAAKPRYIDIGINLTDPVYRGIYHGTQRHPDDLLDVLSRAQEAGCQKLIITGSDLTESEKAIELAKQHPGYLFCTVGIHPCSSQIFTKHPSGPDSVLSSLRALALQAFNNDTTTNSDDPSSTTTSPSPIVAFGELGLDYDRLTLCPRATQLHSFTTQLDLFISLSHPHPPSPSPSPSPSPAPALIPLPLFLHSRAAHSDLIQILRPRLASLPRRGVVHSFTGTLAEMQELVSLGFDIGINGCSLKTRENIEVVRAVPWERLQLETDGPWCEIRAGHVGGQFLEGGGDGDGDGGKMGEGKEQGAKGPRWRSVKKEKWVEGAMVKGRNEPCMISKVAMAVAGIRGVSVEEVTERAWENSVRMFGLGER